MSWWQIVLAVIGALAVAAFIFFAMRQGEKVPPDSSGSGGTYS